MGVDPLPFWLLKVWDSSSLALLGVLRGHRRGVWCVQFSPVDEVLATASADATIKIWTVTDFSNAIVSNK